MTRTPEKRRNEALRIALYFVGLLLLISAVAEIGRIFWPPGN